MGRLYIVVSQVLMRKGILRMSFVSRAVLFYWLVYIVWPGQREAAINRATGEAQAILAKAKARAEAIDMVSKALNQAVRIISYFS